MTFNDIVQPFSAVASVLLGKSEPVLQIGSLVELPDGRRGFVQNIKVSPYWPEEVKGIIRVYIYSAKWFDQQEPERWVEWARIDECEVIQ